jgi:hypothetical protein
VDLAVDKCHVVRFTTEKGLILPFVGVHERFHDRVDPVIRLEVTQLRSYFRWRLGIPNTVGCYVYEEGCQGSCQVHE